MRIHVINPNTSDAMTDKIAVAARSASRMAEISVITNPEGPPSIESHFDEAMAIPGLLKSINEVIEYGESDGILIACFGDPGIHAAREISTVPVVGIAEAAMRTAAVISRRFSIVSVHSRRFPTIEKILIDAGLKHSCVKLRSCEISVSDFEGDVSGTKAYTTLLEECVKAVKEDHIDALVLGCAGMADLIAAVKREIGIPVIHGVSAGIQLLESLSMLGLQPAKVGDRATPPAKLIKGPYADMSRY